MIYAQCYFYEEDISVILPDFIIWNLDDTRYSIIKFYERIYSSFDLTVPRDRDLLLSLPADYLRVDSEPT